MKYRLGVLRTDPVKVVAGSASLALGKELARELQASLVDVSFEKHPGGFPDGEQYVRLLDSVEGENVVLIQSTHPDPRTIELFLLQDALAEARAHWRAGFKSKPTLYTPLASTTPMPLSFSTCLQRI